jgi:hypothetical protein
MSRCRYVIGGSAILAGVWIAAGLVRLSSPGLTGARAEDLPDPGCPSPPVLQPSFPAEGPDPTRLGPTIQAQFDCYAWQEFVALNWPADAEHPGQPDMSKKPADLGKPLDSSLVVWQTYPGVAETFWNQPLNPSTPRHLWMVKRIRDASDAEVQSSISQAFPPNCWLTTQYGTLCYNDIRVNLEQYDAIRKHQFTDPAKQYQSCTTGFPEDRPQFKGIYLPYGTIEGGLNVGIDPMDGSKREGGVGSVELKSAWADLTGVAPEVRRRYKTMAAVICDYTTRRPREAVLGLVGLHIVHKSRLNPGWIWATFEHVDNYPDQGKPEPGKKYLFYPEPTTGRPNRPPELPYSTPVRVERVVPIDREARQASAYFQTLYRNANRDSVWQNYQLVNVQWFDPRENYASGPRITDPSPKAEAPRTLLNPGGPFPRPDPSKPALTPVANPTLETYVQKSSCYFCHRGSHIAYSDQYPEGTFSGTSRQYAADFSYFLRFAGSKPKDPCAEGN